MNYNEMQQEVINDILTHKTKVERVADANLISLLKIEELKELYDKIKDQKRELAKLEKTTKQSQNLENCILSDRAKLIKLAKLKNIDFLGLIPKYWCKKCKDTTIDGKQICACVKKLTTERLMLSEIDDNASFETANFDIFENKDFVKSLYKKAKLYIDKMDTTKFNNFTILGGVGVGKTNLLQCMSKYALELNRYVIYLSAFRLNETFLNYYTAPMADKNRILKPLLDCEVLFIDDLGCEQLLNNVTVPMLTMLINERSSVRKKTVITSNLSIDEIRDRYDYRLCSRLVDTNESIIISFEGTDLRQKR